MEEDYTTNNSYSDKFWMVVGNGNSPKVRHATKSLAVQEAERLAKLNPGTNFYVVESVFVVAQPANLVRRSL